MARYLDLDEVEELVLLRAEIRRKQKKEKALAENLKKLLQKGCKCPTTGPYLLSLQFDLGRIDWKERCVRYLAKYKYDGDLEAAVKFTEKIKAQASREDVVKLKVDQNPAYKEKKRAA